MSRTDLHFNVTTDDGSVSYTFFNTGSRTWAQFAPITELSEDGVKNVSVVNSAIGVDAIHVFSIDDSLPSRLRFTSKIHDRPFRPARLAAIAVGRARCRVENIIAEGDSTVTVWALGGPTIPGRSFGLPAFFIDGTTIKDLGDQLSRIDLGPIDPGDPAIAFEMFGHFVFLATESGGLYFVDTKRQRPSQV